MKKRKYFNKTPYLYLVPTLIVIIPIMIIPIIITFLISFTDSRLMTIGTSANFVGLQNYLTFFRSGHYIQTLGSTFIYVIAGVSLTFIYGLGAALLLNTKFKGRPFFRTILILPWVVPQVVLAIIWKFMVNPQNGVINYFLYSLGIIPQNFSWFGTGVNAMVILTIVTLWKQYPLSLLILFAGLKTISEDLYEAASIDGANYFQKFINITLPGLRKVTNVLLLLLTIWSFGNFTIIWLISKGGPNNQTAVLTVWSYLNAFKFDKLGYGAAIGIIILIISLIFAILYFKIFLNNEEED